MLAAGCLFAALLLPPQDPLREVIRQDYPGGGPRLEQEVTRDEQGKPVPDGSSREWYESGQVASEGRYADGFKLGLWRYWYESGERSARGRFERGVRAGKWFFWNPDGSEDIGRTGNWQRELLEDEAGDLIAVGYRLDGRRVGVWNFLWPDGQLQFTGRYRNGLRQGAWVFFHQDGAPAPLLLTGEYDAGVWQRPLEPERLIDFEPESDEGLEAPTRTGRKAAAGEQRPELDPAHLPVDWDRVLPELEALDLGDPAVVARLGTQSPTPAVLAALGCSQGFGWSSEATPEGLAQRREVVRSLRSLWELERHDEVYWTLDFQTAGERADQVLRLPPILREDRAGFSEAGQLQAYFAGRFGEGKRALHATTLAGALAWLARHQADDGGWYSMRFMAAGEHGAGCVCTGAGQEGWQVGVTALALLAFLGDGHTPYGGEYSAQVTRALSFLLSYQDAKTGRMRSTWKAADGSGYYQGLFLYEHALATNALAEAYALSGHPGLGDALRAAVEFLLRSRNPYSGWRYSSPPDGESDTSVTAWAVQALRAAQIAGVDVDSAALTGALSWIDENTDPATGRCGYNQIGSTSSRVPGVNDHFPPVKGEAMTAAALMSRFLLGQSPEQEPILAKHARLLTQKLPAWDPEGLGCDMYYWYYGSHALYQLGGREWPVWERAVKKALVESQRKDGDLLGSWDPVGPWGFAGGRVYATAMQALSLESTERIGRLASE